MADLSKIKVEDLTFDQIKGVITEIYEMIHPINDGEVASYIPELAEVSPDLFGVSVCHVNGETFSLGDTNCEFSLQSTSKPLTYCIARDLIGHDEVHKKVGYEPSGRAFNAFVLDDDGLPHNPMINAGAIMVASLIKEGEEPSERLKTIKRTLTKMAGGKKIGDSAEIFSSEKFHADRNKALAYYMRESGAFGKKVNIDETLDLYFQACSILVNCESSAIITGTLANNGYCPTTGEKIFSPEVVRDCLSLMFLCGMYDYSGRFAFEIGLPAKSGVSGCLFLVVPNVMGICIWSPRLDQYGNTVRGVRFCQELVKRLDIHMFHKMVANKDVKLSVETVLSLASQGKLDKIQKLMKSNPGYDLNKPDYDRRTAIHLAAADGQVEVVKYLIEQGVDQHPKDRWGRTPLSDAKYNLEKIEDHASEEAERYSEIITLLGETLPALSST